MSRKTATTPISSGNPGRPVRDLLPPPKRLCEFTVRLAAPESEIDPKFLQGMANRMAVSFHKYGPVADGYPDNVDALGSLTQRIAMYLETGNTEYLMDAANFAMIEFMHPSLRGAHFTATDSDGSPGRVRADGSVNAEPNGASA